MAEQKTIEALFAAKLYRDTKGKTLLTDGAVMQICEVVDELAKGKAEAEAARDQACGYEQERIAELTRERDEARDQFEQIAKALGDERDGFEQIAKALGCVDRPEGLGPMYGTLADVLRRIGQLTGAAAEVERRNEAIEGLKKKALAELQRLDRELKKRISYTAPEALRELLAESFQPILASALEALEAL